MASSSQHRCVFVGNIPYDATEEQLVQICEEVGPVVSFRLVLDRETRKPKGYGFCDYKDEETASSARRNLQGYEINGRQLRVDFAENDKDRNQEQGRGGPGLTPNIDAQKISSGPPLPGNSSIQQPVGLPLAANAASIMAGALGGIQSSNTPTQNPFGFGSDPLTLHLAKMSRNQLHEIMFEMKALISRDKTLALRVLQRYPHLSKALFQSQIMLGMVPQQMIAHIYQSGSAIMKPQTSNNDQPMALTHPAKLPASQNAACIGIYPQPEDGQMPMLLQNPLSPQQLHIQPGYQSLSGPTQPSTQPIMTGIQPSLTQQPNQQHSVFAIANTNAQQLAQPPPSQGSRPQVLPNSAMESLEKLLKGIDAQESTTRPSKLSRMEDGSHATQIMSGSTYTTASIPGLGFIPGSGSTDQVTNVDPKQSEKQTQFLPEAEAALLQQVMNLTAEQLNSLPPEQRQQVVQLHQMLRS